MSMTDADLNAIRQQIENLGNRMEDKLERVRVELTASMQSYVLNSVHQKDMERLNERDEQQQHLIDELQKKLDGLFVKCISVCGGIVSVIVGVLAILHYAHFI